MGGRLFILVVGHRGVSRYWGWVPLLVLPWDGWLAGPGSFVGTAALVGRPGAAFHARAGRAVPRKLAQRLALELEPAVTPVRVRGASHPSRAAGRNRAGRGAGVVGETRTTKSCACLDANFTANSKRALVAESGSRIAEHRCGLLLLKLGKPKPHRRQKEAPPLKEVSVAI